jgi:hypothetical protein
MLTTIEFDNQSFLVAIEINDEWPDWNLSSKFEP